MRRSAFLVGVCCLVVGPIAGAQEAMYTAAATMPSPHTGIVREQLHYFRYSSNPNEGTDHTDVFEARTGLAYGLARGLGLFVDVPLLVEHESGGSSNAGDGWDHGVGDIDAMFKYRVYKDDTGGVDTFRVALLGGASFASGDDHDFSSESINPHGGIVGTLVRGRHGCNGELHYYWNTGGDVRSNLGGEGPSDAVRVNGSYLYRIAPAAFTAESKGAWYVTAELNYLYETNADHDLRFSPGLMYEGWNMAFELMMQLPLYQHVDHRAELVVGIGVGVRISF